MPLFTFYPCRPDGSCPGFETVECADDASALVRARRVLAEHDSSVEVIVWQAERRVAVVQRTESLA
ncbi:MAG: hypothetical protein ACOY5Y_06695 [Pseudomonadota bacterium]|jgi:hypothetical protein